MQGCVAGAEDTVYMPYKVSVLMVMYVRVKTIKGNETSTSEGRNCWRHIHGEKEPSDTHRGEGLRGCI